MALFLSSSSHEASSLGKLRGHLLSPVPITHLDGKETAEEGTDWECNGEDFISFYAKDGAYIVQRSFKFLG